MKARKWYVTHMLKEYKRILKINFFACGIVMKPYSNHAMQFKFKRAQPHGNFVSVNNS